MLYFNTLSFRSGKLSLQDDFKSFSLLDVGYVRVRRACLGERALHRSGFCFFTRESTTDGPDGGFFSYVSVSARCTHTCLLHLGCHPGIRRWAGLLSAARSSGRSQALGTAPLFWVLYSRSGHLLLPWECGFCLGGGSGGGDISGMESGRGGWRVSALLLCTWWNTLSWAFSPGLFEHWPSLLYSDSCTKSWSCS